MTGLDSTAARTFATLVTTLASQRVNVIFANLSRPAAHDAMRQLLGANGLPLRPFVAPPAGSAAAAAATAAANGANGANGGAVAAEGHAGAAASGEASKAPPAEAESPLLREWGHGSCM